MTRQKEDLGRKFYSKNSATTRSMQIKKYFAFIEEHKGLAPIPCDSNQVALYITWLCKFLKYSSITNYLSALNHFLKSENCTAIDYKDYQVKSVLGGAKRTLGMQTRQATPLLPANLIKMFIYMSETQGHTAIRAAILTSFRALLRKSQITESEATLLRSDFTFFSWGMQLRVRRSKTIQFLERELLIPVAKTSNIELCAVYWCARHFEEMPASPKSPAFLVPGYETNSPLNYQTLQATIKHLCKMSGLEPLEFSSHSLRRGGATFLAQQGASIEEIKSRGDWSSDCVYKYIKTPLSERIVFDMRVAASLNCL